MQHAAGTLRHLVLRHAQLILAHPLQFRVVERNESNLPPKQQFQHAIEYVIEQGQSLLMDAKMAASSIIGMCNWTVCIPRNWKTSGNCGNRAPPPSFNCFAAATTCWSAIWG